MTVATARKLRQRLTDAERALWARLRRKQIEGFRFRHQASIAPHVVDFLCLEARLIVEVGGGQHAIELAADARRTAWLEGQGFRVVRFWNNDVLQNMDGVVEMIRRALRGRGIPP
jgi:very-short-patch-repair endonuclease